MIDFLTRNPLARALQRFSTWLRVLVTRLADRARGAGVLLRGGMGLLVVGLSALFLATVLDYRDMVEGMRQSAGPGKLEDLPSIVPIVCEGVGVFLALVGFFVSFWVRKSSDPRRNQGFIVIVLSIAAMASLAVWLPADIMDTQAALSGKALAGESPSIPAYLFKLFLISLIILSIPVVALIYFRLGLMDRYIIRSFVGPFTFTLVAFMAIWVIGDQTENGSHLAVLPVGEIFRFYLVQVPFITLFVMPVAVLMSGLSSLSKMSKSNELISMIGVGRSVPRILLPLFIVSAYIALIGLAFKYEWAPTSNGYREAVVQKARRIFAAAALGEEVKSDVWSNRGGWMHVNGVDRRTWFVGRVPLKLSDPMADVVVMELNEQEQPVQMWIARRARWHWSADPPRWVFSDVRIYTYDADHIPTVVRKKQEEITTWSETPWKVLSSSQDPEFLGIPGLTMYLNANREEDDRKLAAFRTNWWYVLAEPAACIVLMLVSAPLGIVYSRRGGMGGVTAAIAVFALMFVMRGTFLAMGHSSRMPPFFAAWSTNIVIGTVGFTMLWLKAQNREIPKLRTLVRFWFQRGRQKNLAQ